MKSRRTYTFLCIFILLSGCGSPMYTDNAAGLKGMSSRGSLKSLSIGVVNTENTVRAYHVRQRP